MDIIALLAALCVLGAIVIGLLGIYNATSSPRTSMDRRLGHLMGESVGDDWAVAGVCGRPARAPRRPHPDHRLPDQGQGLGQRSRREPRTGRHAAHRFGVRGDAHLLRGLFGGVAYVLLGSTIGLVLGVILAFVGFMLPRFYMSRAKASA